MDCPKCNSKHCELGSHSYSGGRIHDAEWHCSNCGWDWIGNPTAQQDSEPAIPVVGIKEWVTEINAAFFTAAYR